jgi:ATP-dependent 26S proteasome regulatory subunit
MLNNHQAMTAIVQARQDEKKRKAARLLVFEDADGLVVDRGFKGSRSGGMARLLNLADGLLGMGQELMVLFTTNSAPGDLDPALSRPGRCLAHTKFDRFEVDEIRTSFPEVATTSSMTLAEIWGAKSGQVNIFDHSHPTKSGTYL